MTSLSVGIIGKKDGWQLMLEQEGVPYAVVGEEMSVDEFSALVVSDGVSPMWLERLRKYLDSGGSVLCSAGTFSQFADVPSNETFIRYLLPEPGSEFSGAGMVDLFCQGFIPQNANSLLNENGQRTAFIGSFRGGTLVVLPFDANELALDARILTKSFYARRNRLPFERVSLVSKRAVRKLVSRSLEMLHHRRGLPYVHKWYYPSDAPSLFALRVDTDSSDRHTIESLHHLAASVNIPLTWFVDTKSQQNFAGVFSSMKADEIGIHCYEHATYPDYQKNIENIRRATNLLHGHGIEATSFAAPYGAWNEAIAAAIEHCGFEYSSEFSYDFDNLPSFPYSDGKPMSTLQVPVHPISIGSLQRQGFDNQEMIDYFRFAMESKLQQRDPLFFYHHPRNNHADVLKVMFEFVHQQSVQAVRMIDYARWWKKRCGVSYRAFVNDNELRIDSGPADDSVYVHITQDSVKESFTPFQSHISMGNLEWNNSPQPMPLRADIHRIRKFNPWIPIVRAEDFLYKLIKKT